MECLKELTEKKIYFKNLTSYDFTYTWSLKHKINEQRKQEQTHGYREHLGYTEGGRGARDSKKSTTLPSVS